MITWPKLAFWASTRERQNMQRTYVSMFSDRHRWAEFIIQKGVGTTARDDLTGVDGPSMFRSTDFIPRGGVE